MNNQTENKGFSPILNTGDATERKELSPSYTSKTMMQYFGETFATELLNIGPIEMGETFRGICYVADMKMIRNKSDKSLYDGRFELIDGKGRKFSATYWAMDEKFETHNSLAFVEGVYYTVGDPNNPRKIYRLDKISQSTLDIPKRVFFKNIEDLDSYRMNVENELKKLVNPDFKKAYEILYAKGIIRDLEMVPFDNINYVEVGSRLKVYMTILMDAVNFNKIYEINFDLLRIGTALALWKPEVKLEISNQSLNLDYNFQVETIIYNLDISLDNKIALLSFIKGDDKTIESIFVRNSISKYNSLLYTIGRETNKVGDIVW